MREQLRPFYNAARDRWTQFQESRTGRYVLKGIRWLFVAAIVGYLGYQLTEIGWAKVWHSLPTTPWFYILLLLMYATLPATEMVLYGTAWNARYRDLLPALLRKRVLNNDVMGYSGEAYFYLWIQRNTNLARRHILKTIKDNTIISSMVSTSVAFLLLALFFLTGQIDLLKQYLPNQTQALGAGIAIIISLVVVGVTLRHVIFSLPASLLWLMGGGHLTRFVLNNGFQVTQWAVVIPEVAVSSWITLIALHIVINQIPFLPSRSLIFLSAGVELSGSLDIPAAAFAGMMLTQTLIDRGLNFLTYVGTTALDAATVEKPDDLDTLSLPEEVT